MINSTSPLTSLSAYLGPVLLLIYIKHKATITLEISHEHPTLLFLYLEIACSII